jgi:hypothetical protein
VGEALVSVSSLLFQSFPISIPQFLGGKKVASRKKGGAQYLELTMMDSEEDHTYDDRLVQYLHHITG